eukprot:COSAG03_NODE_344_length_8812_cov_3.890049_6_plen_335_part_00
MLGQLLRCAGIAATAVAPAAPLAAVSAALCTFEAGTDYQPGDIGQHPAQTREACCALCAADPKCHAAAWNGPTFKTCYLKDQYALPTPSQGTTGCMPKNKPPTPLPPHPPPLPPGSADSCVALTAGELTLCVGSRSGRVRNATIGGTPVELSTWAGPIECATDPHAVVVDVSATTQNEITVRQVCGAADAAACKAPPQPGMGIVGGDSHNVQLLGGASVDSCSSLCCNTAGCTGWVYVPFGPVENGNCHNVRLALCGGPLYRSKLAASTLFPLHAWTCFHRSVVGADIGALLLAEESAGAGTDTKQHCECLGGSCFWPRAATRCDRRADVLGRC